MTVERVIISALKTTSYLFLFTVSLLTILLPFFNKLELSWAESVPYNSLYYIVVLDTMRKAHEVELEKERGKFLDLIAKTYCQADMESLQRQHE